MKLHQQISFAVLVMSVVLGGPIRANTATDSHVSLFKVVTVKDEVVIGVSQNELLGMASSGEETITTLARAIAADGPFTVWQFAVRKVSDGELEEAPSQRISLLDHESLRVEPYKTPLRIVDFK